MRVTYPEIQELVQDIAIQMRDTEQYHKNLHAMAVPILTGSLFFAADLLRAMGWRGTIQPVIASSYIGTNQQEEVSILSPVPVVPDDSQVLIIDTVIDSGKTMRKVISALEDNALGEDVEFAAAILFDKCAHKGLSDVTLYTGTEVDADKFLVGYGLDVNGHGRGTNTIIDYKKGDASGHIDRD